MPEDEIRAANSSNGHGIGIAWYDREKTYYKKGFNVEEFIEFYKDFECIEEHAVHFRLSSSGGVSKGLTHPYLITKNSKLELEYSGTESLLMHNGVIPNWEEDYRIYSLVANNPVPPGPMNDTRALAIQLATLGENYLNYVTGKFAVINPTGIRVFNRSGFEDVDGILYSNCSYKPRTYPVNTGEWGWVNERTTNVVYSKKKRGKKKKTETKTIDELMDEVAKDMNPKYDSSDPFWSDVESFGLR